MMDAASGAVLDPQNERLTSLSVDLVHPPIDAYYLLEIKTGRREHT
jgi:hypothetical protein